MQDHSMCAHSQADDEEGNEVAGPSHTSHTVSGRLYRQGRIRYNFSLQVPGGLVPPGPFPDMDAFTIFVDAHDPFDGMGAFFTSREEDREEVSGFCQVASWKWAFLASRVTA